MSLHYNALYFDLLADLSEYLPSSVVDEESASDQEIWPDISLRQFSALQLSKTLFKKLEDRSNVAADAAALESFLSSNYRCEKWEDLGDPVRGYSPRVESSVDEVLIGEFRKKFYDFYYISGTKCAIEGFHEIVRDGRCGPGASIKARGTDFYTKLFSSPLSATRTSVYDVYTHYTSTIPNWSNAEKLRLEEFGEVDIVEGNRLTFVPKNHNVSRSICTEPNLNMFLQLGIGAQIERRLKSYFGIDLADQPVLNKMLAQVGSAKGTYATVDLSCASDSVSMGMLRENLPKSFVTWLDFARSPKVTLPDGSCKELHMVSSMGNGFTFPLQTAIFCCIVAAVYSALEIKLEKNRTRQRSGMIVKEYGNFGVFGDDIIVETEAYELLVRLLNLLGFSVNSSKSFNKGRFRESCGGDYFDGHPVRGVYIKTLKTQSSRYVAINRLNRWTAVTGIPLQRTIRRLVKSCRFLPVPLEENDDAGIRIPYSELTDNWKRKNPVNGNGAQPYTVWASRPSVIRLRDGEIRPPKGQRKRIWNAPGVLEAFLRGDIKDCTITVRCGQPRYNPRKALTPRWDYVPTVASDIKSEVISQGRLATAIRTNLPG